MRYSTGYIFDDKKEKLSLDDELQLIEDIIKKVRHDQHIVDHRDLTVRLILVGYKVAGHEHVRG